MLQAILLLQRAHSIGLPCAAHTSWCMNGLRLPWPPCKQCMQISEEGAQENQTWLSMPLHRACPKQGEKRFVQGNALCMRGSAAC